MQKLIFFICFIQTVWLNGQSNTVALPSDGTAAQSLAPQGGFRYQRGFYLINPKEMKSSGLVMNDTINCIGFTIGAAQNDTTKGKFKVYLQNTTDSVSRVDTNWTTITGILNNSFTATGLFAGSYEWQVKTNCSEFSSPNQFTNDNFGPCQPPTHLLTSNITSSGATLNWTAPAIGAVKYYVEFKRPEDVSWNRDSTTMTFYILSGLLENKGYQWRVKTKCTTDSSGYSNQEFTTENTDECDEPSSLMTLSTTDTVAKLKWAGVAGADYYTVRFRRMGTVNWQSAISFTDSVTINFGLDAGTAYQWQVASNCGMDSVGTFIQGTNFMTTGLAVCYAPEYLYADSISSSAVKLTWDPVSGASSYEIRYRAKDIISWNNATSPMTLVHNDSISIPDTTGPYYVPFKGAGIVDFLYSGNGIYVAWEYQRAVGALSSRNSSLTTASNSSLKGSYGQDSIKYILSFISRGDSSVSSLDTILNVSDLRPETRLCSPALKDSVEVLAVYALGKNAPRYTSHPVSAVIRNYSGSSQSYPVTMTVKDQNSNMVRYSTTQNIAVGPDTIGLIEFTGWTPALLEVDSIIISVPDQLNENVLNNNRNHYLQMVTRSIVSYEDGSNSITQAGTDTASGLTLSRHLMDGCGKINAVQVFLSQSAKGHPVYAIALDSNRVILAQSPPFTPDSTQVNQYHTFYFTNPRLLKDEKYYIGLAQTASPTGYFPVGVQWEGVQIRDSAYFRGRINGDSIWHHPYPGRLMIRAEIVPGVAVPAITGDLFLCTGTTDTLVASSILARYADSVITYSSQYSEEQYSAREALGTPNVYPAYGSNTSAWLSASDTGREYLVLRFSNPDSVNFVDVFETFNPGALDSIYLKDDGTGLFHLVWSGNAAPAPPMARRNRITFPLTPYKVSAVRLAFNMDTVQGYSSVDAVCIGRITTPGTFSSMVWTGGGTVTGLNGDTLLVSAPGGYKLTTVDATGCMEMDSVTVITPVAVIPVITVTGPTTFCPGDSVKLKSSLTGGNTWSNGATTDSIFVKAAGFYTVSHDDGSGCVITPSLPVSITLYTPPVVTITGDTVICPNDFITLKASLGFSTYLWSTSAATDSINVFVPGQYRVTVTDVNGCKGSDTVITTAGVYPVATITGTLLFCPGDSTTLDAGAGFTSYLWSTGATSDTIVVTTAGSFSVTVTNADGCEASTGQTTSLHTSPNAVISGNDGFCPMDSVQLMASGGISYLWSTGSNAQAIQLNMTGNYILTVTDGNGCQDTATKTIIQFTPPVPFISGTLSFCAGGSVTALTAPIGYNSYLWSTGETSSSILVDTVGTYGVTVTDANGCMGSANATVTQEGGVPEVPGPISGNITGMCNTISPAVYSVAPVPNSTCYVWTVPEGATIVDGFMKDSNVFFETIKVVFDNSFVGGYIEVAAHNDCGLSPSFNGSRLYVTAAPGSVPGAISGQKAGVCKQVATPYSISPITGALSYYWAVPLGAMIVSGQGTPSIMVSFASSFHTGDICVQYSTLCGTSPFECISVQPIPETGSPITGPSVACAFNLNTVYSVPLSAGTVEYQWSVPTGASIVSGQGTNSIQVNFGNISGLVTVKASNNCGDGLFQFLLVNITNCNRIPPLPDQTNRKKQPGFQVSLFPNPSNGLVTLNLQTEVNPAEEHLTLSVYDPLNRLIYSSMVSNSSELKQTLDFRHFTKGVYFLQVKNKSQNYTTKILLH